MKQASDHIGNASHLGTQVLIALIVLLGLLAIPYLIFRMIELRRVRQLVIADLTTSTSDESLEKLVGGLSQAFRECLGQEMAKIRETINRKIARAEIGAWSALPLPDRIRKTADTRAKYLADALSGILKSATGDSSAATGALGALMTFLLKQHGTAVTTLLISRGADPANLGMSLGIADMNDEGAPEPFTVMDVPAPTRTGSNDCVSPPRKLPTEKKRKADGLLKIGRRLIALISHAHANQDGSDSNVDPSKGSDERYLAMFPVASLLLALRLRAQDFEDDLARNRLRRLSPIKVLQFGPRKAWTLRAREDRGKVRNFIGMVTQAYAWSKPGYVQVILDAAVDELQMALREMPWYYQPYLNLGDTYVMKATELGLDEDTAQKWLKCAIENYDQALKVWEANGQSLPEFVSIERLLQLCAAFAKLQTYDDDRFEEAKDLWEQAAHCWHPEKESSSRLLYNWAAVMSRRADRRSWLEAWSEQATGAERTRVERLLEKERALPELLAKGREYLGLSLALDDEYWSQSDCDMDIAALRGKCGFVELKERIRMLQERSDLGKKGEEKLGKEVIKAMRAIEWT